MYRKSIKFLGSFKTFIIVLAFAVITITVGINYPDNNTLGVVAVTGLFSIFIYILMVIPLSISLDNIERTEKEKAKELHKQQVIAEHGAFINDVAERIGNIYDETIDAIDEDVSKDDATIILVEIYHRAPLMGTSYEK